MAFKFRNPFDNGPLSDAQQRDILANQGYVGAVPFVDRAYQNDPLTRVAGSLSDTGGNTEPVQGGYTEGIARALSGLAGGYIGKNQRQKFDVMDKHYAGMANAANRGPVAAAAGITPPAPPANTYSPQTAIARQYGGQPPAAPPGIPSQPSPGALQQVAMAMAPQQQGAPGAPALPGNPPLPGPAPVSPPSTPQRASPSIAASASPRVLTPGEPAGVTRGGQPTARPNTGFNSYQSSAYDPIEAQMAAKHGIPVALLRSIRLAGEKSNAGAVSTAGARSVYQFTPETRRLYMDKYDIDPWAGPEQAVEAAAIHLANDWKRSNGDPAETAASYIAGPSGKGRGRVTRAYVGRVMDMYGQLSEGDEAGSEQGAAPQQVAVPDMPAAPAPVAEPTLKDRVRSRRLEVAHNLLSNEDPNDQAGIFAMTQDLLDKGYSDDQASMMQRDENESQLVNQRYSSELQGYQQGVGDIRQAGIAANRDATLENYARERGATEQQYALDRQSQQDKAALERERVQAEARGNKRPPAAVTNGYLARRSLRRTMGEITDLIKSYPDSVQWGFSKIPQSVLQRYDPNGVQTRAAIASLTGNLLHELSGAAVTDTEAERLLPMLPTSNDTPKGIRDKLARLAVQFQSMDQDARTLYQNPDGTSVFDGLEAASLFSGGSGGPVASGSAPSPGWGAASGN